MDKSAERSCGIDIMKLDLTDAAQLQLLLDIISADKDNILMIFIAPPCGTASRARSRPIKSSLLRGRKQPVPLRSDSQPDGLDGLKGLDKLKTEMANQLYASITVIVLTAHALDLFVVLENPANSLYWKTSFVEQFQSQISGYLTEFHNCCHGGDRDKLTAFWSNKPWLQSLSMRCDGQHLHKSWKPRIHNGQLLFPTAEEAAYPWLLCNRIVHLILQVAKQMGAVAYDTMEQQASQNNFSMLDRYIFNALPRSTKLRPLVPEFATFHYVVTPGQHLDRVAEVLRSFPKGAKLLSRKLWNWGGGNFGRNNSQENAFFLIFWRMRSHKRMW